MTITFRELFELLRATTDAGEWWPGRSRFEIFVGAILVQNTTWTNAQRSIEALRDEALLDPEALAAQSPAGVAELIRPSGFMRAKSTSLVGIARWFVENDARAQGWDDHRLRGELLAQRGVGAETADALLLYAYRRPAFIFDAYARRLLAVVGLGEYPSYDAARRALDERVHGEGLSVDELAAFHGLVIEAGKQARAAGGWDVHWPALQARARAQLPTG